MITLDLRPSSSNDFNIYQTTTLPRCLLVMDLVKTCRADGCCKRLVWLAGGFRPSSHEVACGSDKFFFSSLQDGHFPWIIFACAGTPAFLGGTLRSLSITSSSRPPTASTCYPWHGHSIAQTCPAQVSVSAIKAPEQSNQERARPRIRLVGRQLGPLATGIFPGGLQARTGPVKGVREDISVGVCCVWIWEGTGGFGQNLMCVCV